MHTGCSGNIGDWFLILEKYEWNNKRNSQNDYKISFSNSNAHQNNVKPKLDN